MRASSKRLISAWMCLAIFQGCTPQAPQKPSGTFRVATYNLEWFSEQALTPRVATLKSIINKVAPDIIALQEVESRRALQRLFDSSWSLAITDDPREFQECALAVRAPFRIARYEQLFPGGKFREAFPGGRDVLKVSLEGPNNLKISVYVLHLKSRKGGRLATEPQRILAAQYLATYVKSAKEPAIVLGDLNDDPDDISANILETGNLQASAGRSQDHSLMVNLAEPLFDQDYTSQGLAELQNKRAFSAIVKGSKLEDEQFRGRDYDFNHDARIHQTLLDQILVSPSLAKQAKSYVFATRECVAGKSGKVILRGEDVTYEVQAERPSDHVPLFADLSY